MVVKRKASTTFYFLHKENQMSNLLEAIDGLKGVRRTLKSGAICDCDSTTLCEACSTDSVLQNVQHLLQQLAATFDIRDE